MSVNRFDDLCDELDSAVFNGDWLFDAENRSVFEEYLRRWDVELKSHGAANENNSDNSDYAALRARVARLEEALKEARLQIEYLHGKFQATGSGNAVLARIDSALEEK